MAGAGHSGIGKNGSDSSQSRHARHKTNDNSASGVTRTTDGNPVAQMALHKAPSPVCVGQPSPQSVLTGTSHFLGGGGATDMFPLPCIASYPTGSSELRPPPIVRNTFWVCLGGRKSIGCR